MNPFSQYNLYYDITELIQQRVIVWNGAAELLQSLDRLPSIPSHIGSESVYFKKVVVRDIEFDDNTEEGQKTLLDRLFLIIFHWVLEHSSELKETILEIEMLKDGWNFKLRMSVYTRILI
jgi:hypothetical protein